MFSFILRRVLRVSLLLSGVSLVMFLLMHAIPGTPWSSYANQPRAILNFEPDKIFLDTLNQRFGLNQPLWRQYVRYVFGDVDAEGHLFCGAICGNLGPSFQQRGRSVQNILFAPTEGHPALDSRFGYSLRLVLLGFVFALGSGIPLGILSALEPRSRLSRGISVGLATLLSVPNFVLGLFAIIVLASWLKLIKVLPDWSQPISWILPALVLAVMPMAALARVTRGALLNVLHEDYIRTARAKGLTQTRVMLVHVFRNVRAPLLTFLGPTLMEMFTGLLIVEQLFAFPGFGRQYWVAVLALDYPMIMGLTWLYAFGSALITLLIDVVNAFLDPRLGRLPRDGLT